MAAPSRLSAVVFTDLEGYTWQSQRDESRALGLLEEQESLIGPHLTRHHGRKVKSTGDGFLLEFATALDAVECSIAIQQAVHDRNSNASLPPLHLRIGVHWGPVQERGGDIVGNAVNIASRLEHLTEPGGVCVSSRVYESVREHASQPLEKIGPIALKGVPGEVEVYRVVLPWAAREPHSPEVSSTRLAVLPFSNVSPDPADGYLADGLTDELISSLSLAAGLRIIARTSVNVYAGTNKPIGQIGTELGVASVITGSVRKAGDDLRITVQLVDARTEEPRWTQVFDRKLENVFALQSDIARHVAAALPHKLPPVKEGARAPTANLRAYQLYLRARAIWTNRASDAVLTALHYFEEARDLDPEFSQVYSGIADCLSVLGDLGAMPWSTAAPRAISAARQAVALDARNAAAHASLALVLTRQYEWGEAEREFRIAIQLDPGYAPAHHWYYLLLRTERRMDEGRRQLVQAWESDPLSPIINLHRGIVEWLDHRPTEALAWTTRALELDPRFEMAYVYQVFIHRSRGDRPSAMASFERFKTLDSAGQINNSWYGLLLADLGMVSEANAWIVQQLARPDPVRVHPMSIAWAYGALGDHDRCFEWLARSVDDIMFGPLVLMTNEVFRELRSDPRFAEYLRRIRLNPTPDV